MINTNSKGIILVADDSMESLGLLNESLIREGYTVFIAMDGSQALAIANRMMPDLVLMDALMPNLDGFEACKALKNDPELKDIPVIFMTGLSAPEHVIQGLEAGGVDYVNKPVNIDVLLARIKVHLDNARQTRNTKSALYELGHHVFATDMHGRVLWCTPSARSYIADSGVDKHWIADQLSAHFTEWLASHPKPNSPLKLGDEQHQIHIRYLARSAPNEFLFRLQGNDELTARTQLREAFRLTEREAEVLYWVSQGKTNNEIAQILSMSPRTVNKHLEPVYRKLAVENRTTAAAVCLQVLNNQN